MNTLKPITIFLIGAVGYGMIETAFRGSTHWTMILTGGACLLTLYYLNRQFPHAGYLTKAICGGLVITVYEFAVGCIVNLWFHWKVWDYSNYSYNIFGQVCLLFTFLWIFLCMILVSITKLPKFFKLN